LQAYHAQHELLLLSVPAGLAVEKGILQLLCSERLPGAVKDADKAQDIQQRGSKRSRRESLTHSDDSATDVTIQDTHPEQSCMPQHKQHKPPHHLGALQDWQLHRADHTTSMQRQEVSLPGSAALAADALLAVQEPSVIQQHRPQPQLPLQAHTQQHMRNQQQHSLGVPSLLHDLQDTLEPSSHLPPRHRPAGSSRAGSHTASGDVQHHSPGQRKKVTWADEGSAPSRLGTPVAAVPEAAAAAPAEGGVQSGNLAGGLVGPNAQLWQNLLFLQQLQQLSALPAPELQQLLQELTELDSVWRHSSTCGAWSGRAGSCTGRSCCSSHIPNQPTQHYKERLLLMKRYGILPGAAGQFEVQLQHVQAVLAAVQGPQSHHGPCQDAAAQLGAQHSGFLQDYAPPVKHSGVAAAAPAGSDSSAHTCNTA
jgi:hypothetical protein